MTAFESQGCQLLEKTTHSLKFLVKNEIKALFPLLENEAIIDFTIQPQELEDKFLSLYKKDGK